jgi:hypothetical protein
MVSLHDAATLRPGRRISLKPSPISTPAAVFVCSVTSKLESLHVTSEATMQRFRTAHLIAAVLVLSAAVSFVTGLRGAHFLSLETARIFAFVVFAANIVVSLIGVFTPHRVAWLSYLSASVASMLLLSMATPLTAAWLVIRVAARVIFLGEHLSLF